MSASPIVIAHRGASGYLPEHTLAGKALAFGLGADYLEQDVVATRDGKLVVLHDVYLDYVTDVAQKFAERRRADGHYYVIDFDFAELRTLEVFERRRIDGDGAMFPRRFPRKASAGFRIVTLDEELALVQGLAHSTGRTVGIYPEIKAPAWHKEHGVDLARLVVDALARYGYGSAADPVFLQCFDPDTLHCVRRELGCKLKLVQLVDGSAAYAELLTPSGLRGVADYANGLGPHYAQLVAAAGTAAPQPAPLVQHAREAGLALHAYTFRADALPPYAASLEELLTWFFQTVRIDGAFCDQPDIAVRARARLRAAGK